jgi:hypothetical protein
MDHPVIKLGKIKNTKRNAEPCMVRVTGAVSHVLPYLLNEGYRYRRWTWATQAASPCPKRRSGRNLWCRTLHWGLQIGAPLGSCYSRIGAAAPSAGRPAGSAAPTFPDRRRQQGASAVGKRHISGTSSRQSLGQASPARARLSMSWGWTGKKMYWDFGERRLTGRE